MQIEELAWSGIYHLVYFREKAYCSFDCLYMCCTFAYQKVNTPSVRKYLSSKWIKGDVSRCILVLDTSLFIHFDDKYFRTEGVLQE